MKALITRKVGMTSIIAANGVVSAVTLLSASPNIVIQTKTEDADGYSATQLGFETDSAPLKPQIGHNKNSGVAPNVVREFRSDKVIDKTPDTLAVGDSISADCFSIGDKVQVTGQSKGKGWAGTIKRHNFHRGRKTHGGGSYRRPGSIGSMYPQKIFKGKRMAGQTGGDRVSVRNLQVALIDLENNILGVTGAVPGPRKGIVLVRGLL